MCAHITLLGILPQPARDQGRSSHCVNGTFAAIVLAPAEGKGRLSWFGVSGEANERGWTEHILDPALDHAHGLELADMDGDGQLDVIVAKMHQASAPQEVAIYLNRGRGLVWIKYIVATTGSHNVTAVDIDNDGKVDIVGANWNNHSVTHGTIEVWMQESAPQSSGRF